MKRVQKGLFIAIALAGANLLNAQSKPITTDKKLIIYNEKAVNTTQLEFSPTFYEDGIVFISSLVAAGKEKIFDEHINRKTMSIYAAFRGENGKLLAPKLFADELVSLLHEGPLTFDQFNENIYFTRNNSKGTKTTYADGVSRLKIYSARRDKKTWTDITELPFNDDKSDACHPTISIDGERLYFSSNRPGGFGGMDLYVCEKMNGKWGTPVNLGPKVNTSKNEVFPYIHNSGTLFFASDGLAGLGGIDIFYTAPLSKNSFDTPVNMGKSFNTNKDDFGLIVDADMKNGYFTSARAGGSGEDDIYSFNAPNGLLSYLGSENEETVSKTSKIAGQTTVHVLDRKTGKEIESAEVSFVNLCEITAADLLGNNDEIKMPTNGMFPIDNNNPKITHKLTDVRGETANAMPKGCKYIINVLKQQYIQRQVIIKEDDTRTDIIVLLDKVGENMPNNKPEENLDASVLASNSGVVEGSVYRLNNIYYNFNDASIRPDATKDLDNVVAMMKKFTDVEIELSSHTDIRGTDEYNKDLSQRRATNAVLYLVNQGISRNRVKAVGYGESVLKVKCTVCTEFEHQSNRRTEVKILKGSIKSKVKVNNNQPSYIDDKKTK